MALALSKRSGTATAVAEEPVVAPEDVVGLRKAGPEARVYGRAQTSTPEFRSWFGRSVICEENGEPTVVYHGTTARESFSEFAAGELLEHPDYDGLVRQGSGHDPVTYLGSHFAFESQVADRFAEGLYGDAKWAQGRNGRVYPVYLRVEYPLRIKESDLVKLLEECDCNSTSVEAELERCDWDADWTRNWDESKWGPICFDAASERYGQDAGFRAVINRHAIAWEAGAEEFHPEMCVEMAGQLRERLMREGYDGIVYDNEGEGGISICVFDPVQVKSAIGNGGEFDKFCGDIRS